MSLTILASFVAVVMLCDNTLAWNNEMDGYMEKNCGSYHAFYRIKSEHSNYYNDRKWEWYCGTKSAIANGRTCQWYEDVNTHDGVMDFNCPSGSIVAGAKSTHSNYYNDRVFDFKCCQTAWPYHCTASNRQTTNYINSMDGDMDWTTSKYIEGFYSFHSNYYNDRQWKVKTVDLNCRKTCACPAFVDSSWNVKSLTYDINYGQQAQGTPEVLHTAEYDNTDSPGPGTESFTFSETKTFTSSYESSSEVGVTTGFSFSYGVPEVSSVTGYVEVSAAFGQAWGQTHETSKVYESASSVEVPPGTAIRMTATVKQGSMSLPFTMTLGKSDCECVVSGTWSGVTYFNKRTVVEDITHEIQGRSVEERSTSDDESDEAECTQGSNGWECKDKKVKFVEFDGFSIASGAVNTANKMEGKTAPECFKECQGESNCVGVVRKSSVGLEDADECYSVGQADIETDCKPDDASDNAFVVWIEMGRKHDCELPDKP